MMARFDVPYIPRICTACGREKNAVIKFRGRVLNGKRCYNPWCIDCEDKRDRKVNNHNAKKRRFVHNLSKRYGITKAEYMELLVEQDYGCAICKRHFPVLNVDHDHATGLVRGLLCRDCNLGIGYFKDTPELLQAAILYLKGADGGQAGIPDVGSEV